MQFLVFATFFLAVAEAHRLAGWYRCHWPRSYHQSGYKYAPSKIANIDYGKTKIRYLTKREAEADPAVCTPYPRNIKTEDSNYGPTKIKYFGKGKDAPKEKRKDTDLPVIIFQGRPFATASFLKKTIDKCLEDNCKLPQLLSKLAFLREDNQQMANLQRRQSDIMKAIVPVLKNTISQKSKQLNPEITPVNNSTPNEPDYYGEEEISCLEIASDGYICVPNNQCEGLLEVRGAGEPTCEDKSLKCCHESKQLKPEITSVINSTLEDPNNIPTY